jgi:hypothetical protein
LSRFFEGATGIKAAAGTAVGTIASGFASFVGLIPDDVGKIVSLIGGILSLVMIQYWRANHRKVLQDIKLGETEYKIKQLQLRRLIQESDKP